MQIKSKGEQKIIIDKYMKICNKKKQEEEELEEEKIVTANMAIMKELMDKNKNKKLNFNDYQKILKLNTKFLLKTQIELCKIYLKTIFDNVTLTHQQEEEIKPLIESFPNINI